MHHPPAGVKRSFPFTVSPITSNRLRPSASSSSIDKSRAARARRSLPLVSILVICVQNRPPSHSDEPRLPYGQLDRKSRINRSRPEPITPRNGYRSSCVSMICVRAAWVEGQASRMILWKSAANSPSVGQLVHDDAGMLRFGRGQMDNRRVNAHERTESPRILRIAW